MMEYQDIQEQDFSFLGRGSSVTGTLRLSGRTHLCSELEGEIIMDGEDSFLQIERSARIRGKIQGHHVEIHGQFEGEINCDANLEIFPPAVVKGVIRAKNLVIHPGAIVDMDCETLQ